MNVLYKLLEKALTMILVGFLLSVATFSYFTGHFPPKREHLRQAYALVKQIYPSPSGNQGQAQTSASGQAPNLEQIVQIQKQGLRRLEAVLSLQKIFERFPQGTPNQELNQKINEVAQKLDEAQRGLDGINQSLKNLMEER